MKQRRGSHTVNQADQKLVYGRGNKFEGESRDESRYVSGKTNHY